MEYNRDAAIKAKKLAEKKLGDKDFASAKKYALKAQTLYPDLDGISLLSTIADVYISAEKKVSGEADWYGILGANPGDDDDTIKKQYRKLALMLHPDKNKCVGADGAFQLVSQAWTLLSDKGKRRGRPAPDTFWTVCHGCKMQYEYLKVYLDQTLLCPNCHNPFLAKQSAPPHNLNHQYHSSLSNNRDRFWIPETDPSIASKAANVIQRVNERLKREREQLSPGYGLPCKNRKTEMPIPNRSGNNNTTRELTVFETRKILVNKARKEICRKLNEWLSENKKPPANNVKVSNQTMDIEEPQAMSVPDPDFHNFDSDRTENSFQDYQVWSAYDDDDGMPRFYALVHKVLSRKPLEMKISWLNSKTTAEFGNMEWIGCGFRKTCGEFRVGKFQTNTSLNSFSQKVKFTKTPRGSVVIHPKKGDVWALYRNWSLDWNESVPDHVIHQYDMVEVVDDYNEQGGVSVRPLVKLTGFRTVFCPNTDETEVRKIPKEQVLRFSHQVPNYLLTGKEARNAPKGYLELDPAATPLDLLIHTTT
ncbi:hypothetical protein LXL04_011835 [Taraxacum kok-saghyz]